MQQFKRWLALILIGAVVHLLVPWPVSAQPPDKEQKAEDVQKQAEEAQKALEIGDPRKAGHLITSMRWRHGLIAFPRPGQVINGR